MKIYIRANAPQHDDDLDVNPRKLNTSAGKKKQSKPTSISDKKFNDKIAEIQQHIGKDATPHKLMSELFELKRYILTPAQSASLEKLREQIVEHYKP